MMWKKTFHVDDDLLRQFILMVMITWDSLQGSSWWSWLLRKGSVHTLGNGSVHLKPIMRCFLTHSSSCREQCSWRCTRQTGWCRRTLQIPPLPIWWCMCLILLWIIVIVPKRQKMQNLSERLKNLFWSLFITMIDLIKSYPVTGLS